MVVEPDSDAAKEYDNSDIDYIASSFSSAPHVARCGITGMLRDTILRILIYVIKWARMDLVSFEI